MYYLNSEWVARSISYHGLPLQKMWEGERGHEDLPKIGIHYPDYSLYQARQKYLTFQDRAKRLKLHQFISKKADELFDSQLGGGPSAKRSPVSSEDGTLVRMAPYEVFLNVDIAERQRHFFMTIKSGDIVYGMVSNVLTNGLVIKPICATGSVQRFVGDIGIKAFVAKYNLAPVVNKGSDKFTVNDYVCCEVLEVIPDAYKLILGMLGEFPRTDDGPPFGLITTENFPDVYKTAAQIKGRNYIEVLEESLAFHNPRTEELLYEELGLDFNHYYTNMSSLRGRFSEKEYAGELRQSQASKWAFRSVAEGIEHFKEGRHSEAFQCLNKALNMDPRNVEGLVARGALYANSGSFKKAVEDFECALKLNSSHANARKYLGETLVALGRSYEEENKFDDAKKAYQDCLKVVPNHEEAYNSLEYLKTRFTGKQIVEPNELELPPLNLNKGSDGKGEKQKDDDRKDKSKKRDKDKKKKAKKRRSSSSESSSSSDSSDTSSSDSSSSGSSSDSDAGRHSSKKKKSKSDVSPFTQRMGDFSGAAADPFSQFSSGGGDDYEAKVRKFIEMTRDDDDYEEKVRKFVAEAAKYQRERKNSDNKDKKKKKKEEKKAKKESKKKRKKEKHSKSKKDLEELENKKIREALKIFEKLPVLDDLGAKLSKIYADKTQSEEPKSASSSNKIDTSASLYEKVPPPPPNTAGKWKMMFPKDEVGSLPPVHTSKLAPMNRFGQLPMQQAPVVVPEKAPEDTRVPILPPQARRKIPSPLTSYGRGLQRSPPAPPPPVKSGPVVLDKFGNFRLATIDPLPTKPPEPSDYPRSRSRSRGRYRRSRSSSRSRSRSRGRGRRSRSRSFPRNRGRRFGGSRSRSWSRSRSGSPRRFGGSRFRGRGRFESRPPVRGRFESRGSGSRRTFNNRFANRLSGSLSPIRDGPKSPDRRRRSSPERKDRSGDKRDNSLDRRGRGRRSNDRKEDSRRSSDRKDETSSRSGDRREDRKKDLDKKEGEKRDSKRDEGKREERERSGGEKKRSEKSDRSERSERKESGSASKKEGKTEPPPPGDEDFLATEKLLDTARRERKEDMISRNPDLVKRPSDAF